MEKNIKQIVRICDVDIDGNKKLHYALTKIKGVNFSLSNALCKIANLNKEIKIGELSDEDLKKIKDIIDNTSKYNVPSWLLNRRKDYDSGEDIHLYSSNLKLRRSFDIKRLQKIKSYRGLRHAKDLPVRGQSTKAHFRKGKAVGVKKKKQRKKGK
jgi:small subunit ribosomal protein S13